MQEKRCIHRLSHAVATCSLHPEVFRWGIPKTGSTWTSWGEAALLYWGHKGTAPCRFRMVKADTSWFGPKLCQASHQWYRQSTPRWFCLISRFVSSNGKFISLWGLESLAQSFLLFMTAMSSFHPIHFLSVFYNGKTYACPLRLLSSISLSKPDLHPLDN